MGSIDVAVAETQILRDFDLRQTRDWISRRLQRSDVVFPIVSLEDYWTPYARVKELHGFCFGLTKTKLEQATLDCLRQLVEGVDDSWTSESGDQLLLLARAICSASTVTPFFRLIVERGLFGNGNGGKSIEKRALQSLLYVEWKGDLEFWRSMYDRNHGYLSLVFDGLLNLSPDAAFNFIENKIELANDSDRSAILNSVISFVEEGPEVELQDVTALIERLPREFRDDVQTSLSLGEDKFQPTDIVKFQDTQIEFDTDVASAESRPRTRVSKKTLVPSLSGFVSDVVKRVIEVVEVPPSLSLATVPSGYIANRTGSSGDQPRLKEHYLNVAVPALMTEFKYKNIMQAPRIEKVVVNMGVGAAGQTGGDPKLLDNAIRDLTAITGQKPAVTRAKKSIANFKLRAGARIGAKVTLRGDRMYEFLDRLFNITLPRVRDFQGISPNAFDGHGNFAMGMKEQLTFPEIEYDKIDKIRGMDIIIVTTSNSDQEALFLLQRMGLPFRSTGTASQGGATRLTL